MSDIPDATAVDFFESYLRDLGLEASGEQILSCSSSKKARMAYGLYN
jgi:hypothetical protein